jgi:hypothetical protein
MKQTDSIYAAPVRVCAKVRRVDREWPSARALTDTRKFVVVSFRDIARARVRISLMRLEMWVFGMICSVRT